MGYFKNAEIDSDCNDKQLAFIPRIIRCDPMDLPEEELLEKFVKDEFTLPLLALQLLG